MQTLFKAIIKKYFKSDIESSLSGEDAKMNLQNNSYDIVFIDYNLPNMKGSDIITDEILNKSKIILMSANDIKLDNGISFLKKPINSGMIKNIIEEIKIG